MDIDEEIARALDNLGVDRDEVPAATSKAAVAKAGKQDSESKVAARDTHPAGTKADKRLQQELEAKVKRLEKKLDKAAERELTYKAKITALEGKLKPKAAPKRPERLTFTHPESRDVAVSLDNNIILISRIDCYAVTSSPLNEIEHNRVGIREEAYEMLTAMPEWDWVNERIEACARQWRITRKVPHVKDYVMDGRLVRIMQEEHGIFELHEAYLKAQEGLKGVGAKSIETLKTAYEQYSGDIKLLNSKSKKSEQKGPKKRKGVQR